jgi:hypothetical protein
VADFGDFLMQQGYLAPRRLPDQRWIAVQRFLFTWGLMVGLDDCGYVTRFCYAKLHDALAAAVLWDGTGDPPGPWIKEKGRDGERDGPGAAGS